MGTTYNVVVIHNGGVTEPPVDFYASVQDVLDRVDNAMSTYKEDSEVSRFNRATAADWFPVSPETLTVVTEALRIAELTQGAFDPTVGPLVDVWGFGAASPEAATIPSPAALDAARARVDFRALAVDPTQSAIRKKLDGLQLDLSAIAKGFAVDQLHRFLKAQGYQNFLIEVGGEVRAAGTNAKRVPWRIGIDTPTAGIRTAGTHRLAIEVKDRAVATSGDYRNFREVDGQRVSHTIDPRAGRPITHALASVTVVADTCMEADALATASNVLGPKGGWALLNDHAPKWTGYMILHDGEGKFVDRMETGFQAMLVEP